MEKASFTLRLFTESKIDYSVRNGLESALEDCVFEFCESNNIPLKLLSFR